VKLTSEQIILLKDLMENSARKGNLANSAIVLENGKIIASSESLVVTNHDTTSHSERMLVEKVGHLKNSNYNPGLTMVTVCESCLMCLSACSQAGYKTLAYIIPTTKYVEKIPWMTDNNNVNREEIAKTMSEPIEYIHLDEYEREFSEVFEKEMSPMLKK
jgi:tRNA(Arg) A34 adenosine deaminase TadA